MVFVFLADGFEEIEALTPVDLLRRAGVEVMTVGISGKTVHGAHGISVEADITGEEVLEKIENGETLTMVVFPGGMPGAANLDASPIVNSVISRAVAENAYMAAICAAPMLLGKRGLLRGKQAVCYPGFETYLTEAEIMHEPVVQDGRIITAAAMGAAVPFALRLVTVLKGEGAAEELRAAILA